jgi:selenocysteine lyase/cysteine desulfurase
MTFDLDALKESFDKNKPKLVVVNHGSNVCGVVAPMEQISLLAKRYDALVLVDAAQTLGVLDIDMEKLQIDFLVFAGHKSLLGPIGIGGIAINSRVHLKPFIYGGTGSESESEDMPVDYPERLEAGSPNIVAIAGLYAGIEHVRQNAHLKCHERQLFCELINVLSKYPEIKVYASSCAERRLSVLSCTVAGYTPVEFATVLDQHFGIAVRAGLHCAPRAHQFLGTAPLGTVRFSLGPYNTDADIDALSKALEQLFIM